MTFFVATVAACLCLISPANATSVANSAIDGSTIAIAPDKTGPDKDYADAQVEPPSCVYAYVYDGGIHDIAQVNNTCPVHQRVKVIVAFYYDSECFNMAPNGVAEYAIPAIGRFDGLETC